MKNILRDKTISAAVTADLETVIKQRAEQLNMRTSTFIFELLQSTLRDELSDLKDGKI